MGGIEMHDRLILSRVVAIFLCALLLAIPVLCQQAEIANQARADAQRNVTGGTWLLIGILLGALGYLVAMLVSPKAPAAVLIGKSADYVAIYTQTYEEEGKRIQMRSAMTGCLIGTGVQAAAVLLIVLAAGSSVSHYY